MANGFMIERVSKRRDLKNGNEFHTHLANFYRERGMLGKVPSMAYYEFCDYLMEKNINPPSKEKFFKEVRYVCGLHTKRMRKGGKLIWVYTRIIGVGR